MFGSTWRVPRVCGAGTVRPSRKTGGKPIIVTPPATRATADTTFFASISIRVLALFARRKIGIPHRTARTSNARKLSKELHWNRSDLPRYRREKSIKG